MDKDIPWACPASRARPGACVVLDQSVQAGRRHMVSSKRKHRPSHGKNIKQVLDEIYEILYNIWYGGRPDMAAWPAGQVLFFKGPRPAPPARILLAPEAPQN